MAANPVADLLDKPSNVTALPTGTSLTDLSQLSKLRDVLTYNPSTGHFHWLRTLTSNARQGDRAGGPGGRGYRKLLALGHRFVEHRLAWWFAHGEWPVGDIDHINGDRADNRIANLREATRTENNANRGPGKNNSSGFKGVSYCRKSGRWIAQIGGGPGARIHLGRHATPEEASAAYLAAAKVRYGKFARVA